MELLQSPRGRCACIGCVTSLIAGVLAIVVVAWLATSIDVPGIVRAVVEAGEQGGSAAPPAATPVGPGTDPAPQPDAPVAPGLVPLDGEATLTDQQLNALLAQNIAQLAPIESVELDFNPGRVLARVRISGVDLRVETGAQLVGGRVTLVDTVVTGPMGLALPAESVVAPIEQVLNDQLAQNGVVITTMEIREGAIVIS